MARSLNNLLLDFIRVDNMIEGDKGSSEISRCVVKKGKEKRKIGRRKNKIKKKVDEKKKEKRKEKREKKWDPVDRSTCANRERILEKAGQEPNVWEKKIRRRG